MKGNPKISPDHTYIFDEDDLEELDDLSLTSTLQAASQGSARPDVESGVGPESAEDSMPEDSGTTMDELSIDEMLESMSPDYQHQQEESVSDSDLEDTGTFAALEVLISPKELFPDDN